MQGFSNKQEHIVANPEISETDILGISETWLKPSDTVQVPGFCIEKQSRTSGLRGGVALLLKDSLLGLYERLYVDVIDLEYVAVTIPSMKLTVCTLYRPNSMRKELLQANLKLLLNAVPSNCHTIIGGDFNVDIKGNPQTNAFSLPSDYRQLIAHPTTSYGSLLDHVYMKNLGEEVSYSCGVSGTYYSDHDQTFVSLRLA